MMSNERSITSKESKAVELQLQKISPAIPFPPIQHLPPQYPPVSHFPILSFDCKRAFIKDRMCFNDYIKYIYNPHIHIQHIYIY